MGLGLGLGLDKPKGLIYFQNQFSMEFDGVDDRIITDGADTVAQPTTYSFWCKASETGANHGVFGHGGDNIGGFHFNWASKPLLYLGTSYWVFWNDTSAQDDGEWHHWVVYSDTNNINNCKLYVDGVLQTVFNTATTGSLNAYTESLTIGSDRQVGGNSFLGKIDEFAVFDRELTQAEITRMYNTYYTNNLVKNGNFEEIGGDVVQNGDFEQIGGEEVTNGDFSQIGSEEVTNGDFATDSDWTKGTGITISGGSANFTGNANTFLTQSGVVSSSKTYKATFTVSNYISGAIDINLGGSTRQGNISANGSYVFYITVPSGNILYFQEDFLNGFVGSIENVSVKEVGQDWSLVGDFQIDDTKAFITSASQYSQLTQQLGVNFLTSGKSYKLEADITTSITNALAYRVTGGSIVPIATSDIVDGKYTAYFTMSSNGYFWFQTTGSYTGLNATIDNVSVKEVGQNWTLNGTASISDGKAHINSPSGELAEITQTNALFIGRNYKLTCDLDKTSGDTQFVNGGTFILVDGFNTINFTANSANVYFKRGAGSVVSSLDNIVVQEVGQNWTLGTGWSMGNDLALYSGTANASLSQPNALISGRTYKLQYEVISSSLDGDFKISGGTAAAQNPLSQSVGIHNINFIADGSAPTSMDLRVVINTTGTLEIDNIVVQQLKHQATNLLVNSGDYQSANPLITSTKSMEFDGLDDYLQLGNFNNLGVDNFSISFWVNLDTAANITFASKFEDNSNRILFYTDGSNQIATQGRVGGAYAWNFTGTGTNVLLTDYLNKWTNITFSIDRSSNLLIFINGELKSTTDISSTSATNVDNTGNWSFGKYGSGSYLNGKMTETGIWNRALTSLEVASLYNQGMPTNLLVNRNNYQSGNPTVFNTKQVDFDGTDDYLNAGDVLNLGTEDFSISCWLNSSQSTNYTIGKTQDDGNRWYFRTTGNRFQFHSKAGGSVLMNLTTTETFPLDTWVHLLISADRDGTVYLYINGVQSSVTGAGSATSLDNTGDLTIGRVTFFDSYFDGKISQVGMWNKALTADEVSSLYNHGLPIDLTTNQAAYESSSNLVGYWRMGSGTLDTYPLIADQTNATLGSELVTNGDFSDGTNGWGASGVATINIVNGELEVNVSGGGGGFARTSNIPCVDGRTYLVSIDYRAGTYVGDVSPIIDGVAQDLITPTPVTQTETWKIVANGSSFQLSFVRAAAYTGTIYYDNVSVKEVGGNPAIMTNQTSSDIENGSPYANVIHNGTFDTDSDWTKGTGWSIANGLANCDGTQTGSTNLNNSNSNGLINNIQYIATYTISNYSAGSIRIKLGNSGFGTYNSANGTYTETITAQVTTFPYAQFNADSSFAGSIDNVTVEEVNTGLQGYWKMGDGTNDEYPVIYDQTNPTLSAEKIINGDFSNGTTDWFVTGGSGATISIDNGRLKIDGSSGATAEQTVTAIIGKTYKVTYDLTLGTATSGATIITGGNYPTLDAPEGTNIFYSVATSTSFRVRPRLGSNGTMFVDNISVKEVQGNPAIMTSMPEGNITNQYPLTKLRNYYRMGDGILDSKFLSYPATAAPFIFQDQTSPNLAHIPTTNLVTYSEDTSQWTDSGITYSVDYIISPDGTLNASKAIINDTITSSNTRPMTSVAVTSGTNYVFSVFGKADEFDMINLDFSNTAFSTVSVDYNLTNGTVTSFVGSPVSQGVEDYGNGWYRCYVVATAIATTTTALIIRLDDNPTGDGTSGLYLWGAQAEQQSQATTYLKSDGVASVRKSSTTNLVEYSEDFSQSSWLNINSVALANNVAIAPNGTQTASTLTSTSPSAFQYLKSNIVVSSSTRYTVSVFVKKETTQTLFGGIGLDFTGGTRQVSYAIFDAVNGTINISGYSTNVTSNVVSYNEDWWRIQVNASSNSGNNSLSVSYYGTLSTNGTSVGTGIGSARTIWGYQLEEQTQAETYAPTKGIPVTIDLFKENNYGHTQGGVIQKDVPRNS